MFTCSENLELSEEQRARAADLHRRGMIVAAHTDITPDLAARRRAGARRVFSDLHAPVLLEGGINCVCDHIAGDAPYLVEFPFKNTMAANRLKFALQAVEAVQAEGEESCDTMLIVRSVADIHRAKREGRIAFVQCFEGASAFEDDPTLLAVFHRLGLRVVGLTHDFRNLFADGVRTGSGGGLTHLGRDLLAEMRRLGVVVDVSHLSAEGFWDVVEHAQMPIHASHSNATTLCGVPRNLSDEQIKAIAESGGVIGVHALSALITERGGVPTLDEMLAHIDYLVELAGDDHVAIGPDLMDIWPEAEYERLWRETRIPTITYDYPAEFDTYAKFPNITAGLIARGYSDDSVLKIMGDNMLRLFAAVWGEDGTGDPASPDAQRVATAE